MTTEDRFREELGAYLLGALDIAEEIGVRRHLGSCPACRAELGELDSLPSVLARWTGPGPVTGPVGGAVRSAGRLRLVLSMRRCRGRRLRWVVSGLAAVLVVAALLSWVFLGTTADATLQFTATSAAANSRGSVTYQAESWGTQIAIRAQGLPRGDRCVIWVEGTGGSWEQVGSWSAPNRQGSVVEVASWLPLQDIAGVVLETTNRVPLLRAGAPRRR